jgi:adenosine deaminase
MPVGFFVDLSKVRPMADIIRSIPSEQLGRYRKYSNIRAFIESPEITFNAAEQLFEYESFDQFLATWGFTGRFFRSVEHLRSLIQAVRQSLIKQNISYVELTVSVVEYLDMGLALEDIVEALEEACGQDHPRMRWIVDLVRDTGPESALILFERILVLQPSSLVAITLGGSEHLFPPAQFERLYAAAHGSGLKTSVHAGEGLGPSSVWDAIRILRADRIGHGVRAIEDPALVQYLADNEIPLEVCITSNLRTGIYQNLGEHPVKRLYEAGVPITISTDDPTFFETDLNREFTHLRETGMTDHAVLQVLKNGFRYSFDG